MRLPWQHQNDRHTKKMNEQVLKVKVNLLFKNLKKKTLCMGGGIHELEAFICIYFSERKVLANR